MPVLRYSYRGFSSTIPSKFQGLDQPYRSDQPNNQKKTHFHNESISYYPSFTFGETVMKYLIGLPFFLFGLENVRTGYSRIILRFGKYERTLKSGLNYVLPGNVTTWDTYLGVSTFKINQAKVVDKNGNPVILSAVVNYQIVNPCLFIFDLRADNAFIQNSADMIVKRIASKYPYESKDGLNLKDEAEIIGLEMRNELQKLVQEYGIQINNVGLTDMNYAPEIAGSMLVRQQTLAYIEAKNEIANSSVDIVKQIISNLEKQGYKVSDAYRDQLISNLLTVISSGNSIQPVISLNKR